MNTAAMVTAWITENGVGSIDEYDVPAAAAMLDRWAAEDGTTVTGIAPELVAEAIEGHRNGVRA